MRRGPLLRRPLGGRIPVALVLGGLVAATLLAVAAVVADATLLRPLIRHVVESRSGRHIDFRALRVRLDAGLEPRLELDDLSIDNAPWAVSREPLVRAGKATLELTWDGLVTGVWIVKRLVLEDAQVELERDREGRRNSRLATAEGRGPPRVRILGIDARRSRLQVRDATTGFELRIASTPLVAARTLADRPALPLTRTLVFDGRQRGTAFFGRADVSDTLSLQRSGVEFAVDGEIRTAAGRLTATGVVADLLTAGKVEADLHLAADPLSGLHPGLLPTLPALREVTAGAHLSHDAQGSRLSGLHLRTRGSAVEGDLAYHRAAGPNERPRLVAHLDAARLDIDEWRDARGAGAAKAVAVKAAGPAAARPVSPPASVPAAAAPPATAASTRGRDAAFDWSGLGRVDGTLDLRVAELSLDRMVVARAARLQATLDRARLRLVLPDTRVAGGHGSGELRLDAASVPAQATLQAQVGGVRLRELPARWAALRREVKDGRFSATASLAVRGDSPVDWLGSSTGSVQASLDGATVSDRFEARLGLDGLAFLRSLLSGTDAVPLRCAEVALELKNGRGTVRRLTLDTARVAVAGRGSVDLVGRTLDLVLAPSSHVDALFALDRDIRVQGPIAKPRVSLQARGAPMQTARCAS